MKWHFIFSLLLFSTVLLEAQNIGINTVDPSWKLTVRDTQNAMLDSGRIDVSNLTMVMERITNSDREGVGLGFRNATLSQNIGAAIVHERTGLESKGKLHFATKTNTLTGSDLEVQFTLSDVGYVGIGTTEPSARLHVFGGDFLLDRGTATTDVNRSITVNGAKGGDVSPYARIDLRNLDNNSGNVEYTGASIQSFNADSETSGDLRFVTSKGAEPSEVVRFTETGLIGIGTTTPSSRLTVSDTANALLNSGTIDVSNLAVMINKNAFINNEAVGIGFQSAIVSENVGAAIVHERTGDASKGKLHFAAKSTTGQGADLPIQMTLDDAGKVGIGNTSPSERLHISGGNILLDRGGSTSGISRSVIIEGARGSNASAYARIDFNNIDHNDGNTPYTGASIKSVNATSDDRGDLRFFTNDGTDAIADEIMRITYDGRVGIGTPTPDVDLTVNGSASKLLGGSWATFSDLRLKKEIRSFDHGLEIVNKINPVCYKYNGLGGIDQTEIEEIGVVAQEIQEFAPYMIDLVSRKLRPEDLHPTELLMYNDSALTYVLVNAVQELAAENVELRRRLSRLEEHIDR